jgi:hypothetical protein
VKRSLSRKPMSPFQSFQPLTPLRFVHHGDQSVPGIPIVQSLCSVQNVSGILETSKCSNNRSGGCDAVEPLTLRNTRCHAPTAIFLPGHIWHITHSCHQKHFCRRFAAASILASETARRIIGMHGDIAGVVTFYPGRRSRYESSI